jgi:hypothetical protein
MSTYREDVFGDEPFGQFGPFEGSPFDSSMFRSGVPHDQPREPLHQPPNPVDLRNRPPRTSACAHVREMLRDFVDGDLEQDDACQVEEHIHVCRPCSVELSRAEHELLQLRNAFASLAPREPKLPGGFAAAVVERLVIDDTSMVSPTAMARARTAAAVRAEAERILAEETAQEAAAAADGSAHDVLIGPSGLLVAAASLLLLLGFGAFWFEHGVGAPDHIARLLVVRQDRASNGRGSPLADGIGLGNQQFIKVASGGAAALEFHDASAKSQPAATLALRGEGLRGEGLVCMQDGRPVLLAGELEVVTNREISLPMADGSELRLGVGEYVIVADAGDMFDGALPDDLLASLRSAAAGSPGAALEIEVEVRSGQAGIARATLATQLVAAGQIGTFQGLGQVAIRGRGGDGLAAGNRNVRQSPAPSGPSIASLSGGVVDRFGAAGVGTQLRMTFATAGGLRTGDRVAGTDGRFRLLLESPPTSDFAIVGALPEASRRDLGVVVPDAMQLVRNAGETQFLDSVVLDRATPLEGEVRDDQLQLREGVDVIACVVDEVFGLLLPLGVRTLTSSAGAFRLEGLPARLAPGLGLVLVLSHSDLEPLAVPVPTRGAVIASELLGPMVMQRTFSAVAGLLPENSTVTFWEEVPGLPRGSAVRAIQGNTNASGEASTLPIRNGGGQARLWLRVPQYGTVREMEFNAASNRWEPGSKPDVTLSLVFRPAEDIPGTNLRLASGARHHVFATGGSSSAGASSGGASHRALRVEDAHGRSVAGAQVFAIDATGPQDTADVRFLGFTSTTGATSLEPVRTQGEICVIGPGGSFAWLPDPRDGTGLVRVAVADPGRVLLHPTLRPAVGSPNRVVTLRFERLGASLSGLAPVLHRFAAEGSGWEVDNVPPGEYSVTAGQTTRVVEVPSGGWVELAP